MKDQARITAVKVHGEQQYGSVPYVVHLASVVAILREYGLCDDTYVAAGWLHDSVEDTDITIEEVEQGFGPDVARLVHAVTNEPGRNRKERNAATYPKIASVPGATALKLADRIANVESCWATRDRKLFMYQREYKDFRKALRKDPETDAEVQMWRRLDHLLGWRD